MDLFERLRTSFHAGDLTPTTHRVAPGRLEEFPEERLVPFETLTDDQAACGLEALRGGRWGRLILNGGMATRFGGRVKGICEVYDGRSFLELKLAHMARLESEWDLPEIPVVLMNSPATDGPTTEYLERHEFFGRRRLTSFVQETFPRLTTEGTPLDRQDDKARAPRGHGDFLEGLAASGVLETWQSAGVTHFDFSNIDNLGAAIEPRLTGAFLESGRQMAVELARKNPGDKGGAACLRDGVPGVLEGIYFDPAFDQDRLPWFNTNNLMFSAEGARTLLQDDSFEFPWNVVEKEVDGHSVVQFERIAIDALWGLNRRPGDDRVVFFGVPREGPDGRFYPVKSPGDLDHLRDPLRRRLGV